MDAKELTGIIGELIEAEIDAPQVIDADDVSDLYSRTFEDSGILTDADGLVLVVTDSDGGRREFQITVVQSG